MKTYSKMPRKRITETPVEQARRENKKNVRAVVTKVFEHDGTEEFASNHEVNAQVITGNGEFRRIPVHTDVAGSIYVPQKGDPVEIGYLDGEQQQPVVVNHTYTDETRAPFARSGHFRREFGPEDSEKLYIEAERADHSAGDPNIVRISKKTDGLSDPIAEIVLDDSGSETEIRLTTSESGTFKQAIKDITTTKDGDGHVTSISLERADNVLIR